MNRHGLAIGVCIWIAICVGQAQNRGEDLKKDGFVPSSGFVPTREVAGAIAETVLHPIYGKPEIEIQKPFMIKLSDGVWTVRGNGHGIQAGTFTIKIDKTRGTILYLFHDR